jgi:DDE superfamily endonuclease/Helix-turn-helix of DDE superfamily endonuclease
VLFRCRLDSEISAEELLRYAAMTGLSDEQLTELVARVHAVHGGFSSRGRRPVLGLFRSVALVVCLMRKNLTQQFAGALFGVSQSTVSRRWDLLRPLIGQALAGFVPDPREVVGVGTVLVDGTICPTWDWRDVPDLYSAKAGYAGMNIQIAATMSGRLAAVGPIPVHGARHDAYAFSASDLTTLLGDLSTLADLGYVGVEGIDIVPFKRAAGGDLTTGQAEFNTALSKIRAAVERAIAHLKTWRMLSEEGGRYRAPLEKYQSMLQAVVGLYFFATCE